MNFWGTYAVGAARVILYAYAYVLLEWLFLATKPSFLGVWPIGLRIAGFWIGALPFVGAALTLHVVCCLLDWLVPFLRCNGGRPLPKVATSVVVTAIVLMLVDNFTYTVFGWGVVNTTTWTAPLYWLVALSLFLAHLRRQASPMRARSVLAATLIVVSAGTLLWTILDSPNSPETYPGKGTMAGAQAAGAAGTSRPNIVFFAADGITASRTSAYGYARKTTPNLDSLLNHALVAENAFTNSGWTTGSLTSMMTGKYPTTTKVMYPPYTLKGVDAYQSLPRILHTLGYTNIQETVRYYADGPDLNWQDSFDEANGRTLEPSELDASKAIALQVPVQLDEALYKRLSERVLQLLRIERMADPHAEVTSEQYAKVYGTADDKRMERVYAFIDHARKPFFVHIHLLGTHCCAYHPREQVFSQGYFASEAEKRNAQLDDAILESDRLFGELIQHLRQRGQLDNTLIIYTSDHDNGWDFRAPVPLIFAFPHGDHQGHVTGTTQLLDVAPTVLDYLGISVPDWMEGHSLLRGELAPERPVFSVFRLDRSHFTTSKKDRLARVDNMGPPTYGLSQMGMVVCQRWYVLDLDNGAVTKGKVAAYKGTCPEKALPDDVRARSMISDHLHQRGFVF